MRNLIITNEYNSLSIAPYTRIIYDNSNDKIFVRNIEITTNAYNITTFYCSQSLDFTDSVVKAYVVDSFSDNHLHLTQVYQVPAMTGLILEAPQGTYKIKSGNDNAKLPCTNYLWGVLKDTKINESNDTVYYVLSTLNNEVGFYLPAIGTTYFAANKVYLMKVNDVYIPCTTINNIALNNKLTPNANEKHSQVQPDNIILHMYNYVGNTSEYL